MSSDPSQARPCLISLYSVVGASEKDRRDADGYRSCRNGCGSKFRNEAPLGRHEAVCTYNQITWMGQHQHQHQHQHQQLDNCPADAGPDNTREVTTRRGRGRGRGGRGRGRGTADKSPEKSGENLPWSKWIKKK